MNIFLKILLFKGIDICFNKSTFELRLALKMANVIGMLGSSF